VENVGFLVGLELVWKCWSGWGMVDEVVLVVVGWVQTLLL